MTERVRAGLAVVNPLGWILLLGGLGLLVAARVTHWRELSVVAAGCLLLLLLALPFLLGRTRVRIDLTLDPERVVAGQSVGAGVDVTNVAGARLLPTLLELPVGASVHRYGLPSLAPGATHAESFTIRTEARGVIAVGPATTRRGDPLAAFSRDVAWTGVREVLVRPPMVPLESLGAGLLRDLEGVETDAISQSDLAFHALREYVPGDDLRHVHWRSSAKAMAAGDSQLLVRQYLDTRRSHATLVVDDSAGVWDDPQDYETAMSVAASVIVRAAVDDFETSFVSGAHAASGTDGNRTLDALCRAVPGRSGLVAGARHAARVAGDTSLLFLVTGKHTPFETLQRAAAAFPPEVRAFGVVVDPGSRSRVSEAGGLPVVHLHKAEDLGALLRWSVR